MTVYKFNYFFFVLTIGIPAAMTPVSIVLLWPWIFNPYQLLGPFWGIVVGCGFGTAFVWFAVAYMALPWLAVIREDRITFHRLFRRRLVIPLDKVKNTEVVSKNLPVKEYLWGIGSVSFKMRDGDEWLVSGISHSIILKIYEILEKKGIKWVELNRKLTEKEKESLQKRGY